MKETISIKLFHTLQGGKALLGRDALQRVLGFVESQRTPEDTYVNKSGQVDLYYTLFGWMLSYVLGISLDSKNLEKYLNKQEIEKLDLIHYAAYMRCRMIQRLFKSGKIGYVLNSLSLTPVRHLQGFTGVPNNDQQSPYTQFIRHSLLEDTGHRINENDKGQTLLLLKAYKAVEGGYANLKHARSAATNATVAALAVKGQLSDYSVDDEVGYLRSMQGESGGFSAASASPVPDILSTATSLFILKCYGVKPVFPPRDFIEAHWLDSGGFSATLLEDTSDVEYTFYGLLALGAL